MKPEVKKFFEKLQADINSMSSYLNLILSETVDLDSSKIYIIDYSQYSFFKVEENLRIKSQIDYDSALATQARIRGDFIEFCRCLCLQLELLLSHFYSNRENDPRYLRSRFTHFIKEVGTTPVDKEDIRQRLYWAIDIRNVASHRDTSGFPIEKRIEKKGNTICLYLKRMKEENPETMKKKLQALLEYSDWDAVSVTYKEKGDNGGYAYVDIFGVKLDLTRDEVRNRLEKLFQKVYPKYGENIQVMLNQKQAQKNDLNRFFLDSNYDQLQESFLWFLDKLNKYYS